MEKNLKIDFLIKFFRQKLAFGKGTSRFGNFFLFFQEIILSNKKGLLPSQSQIYRVEDIYKYVTAYQNKAEILRPQLG